MEQVEKLLKVAVGELGVKEQDVNKVKYNTEFYGQIVSGEQYSWCSTFILWLFYKAGILDLTPFYEKGDKLKYNPLNGAYCPNWVVKALMTGQWFTEEYRAGDCILFDNTGNGIADHIGLCESCNDKELVTIEGNVSDSVQRKVYSSWKTNKKILGAYRPRYETVYTLESSVNKLWDMGWIDSPDLWLRAGRGSGVSAENITHLLCKFAQAVERCGRK